MHPIFGLALTVVLVGCSEGSATYEQTWSKSYSTTTCSDWNGKMSDKQQLAAAGDLLWSHVKRNGAKDRPGGSSVEDFRAVLGEECAEHKARTIAEASEGIALPD
jgi:hypothetical protein